MTMMIERFELQGSMLDLELAMQVLGGLLKKRTVAVVDVAYQMSRESRFRGAHRPDVQIVHRGHVRKTGEILSHFGHFNALRYCVECQIERIPHKSPSASGNYGCISESLVWVDPMQTRGDNKKTST